MIIKKTKTTLISFIGLGQRDKNNNTYLNTKYDFGNDEIIKSALFLDAVLLSKRFTFNKCILFGTRTSSWSALLDKDLNKNGNFIELYEKIENEVEAGKIYDESLDELKLALEQLWGIEFVLVATESEINEKNSFEILTQYLNTISIEASESICVDITHGFRYMPVLLMTALQYAKSIGKLFDKFDLIYGEFKNKISTVRYLEPVWEGIKISEAVNLFFDKFDPGKLSDYIEPFWKSGAKAITQIGQSLQGNFIIWINDDLRQLKNALDESKDIADLPQWFIPILKKIEEFYMKLSEPKKQKDKILLLSKMFYERQLYGQAITSLQLSIEAFLFEYYEEEEESYGDYVKTGELYDCFLKKIKSENVKNFDYRKKNNFSKKNQLIGLKNIRNQIAHGGSYSYGGGKPQAYNLNKHYNIYYKLIDTIFKDYKV